MSNRVLVIMEGGLIQFVHADDPSVEVLVVDWDWIDGSDALNDPIDPIAQYTFDSQDVDKVLGEVHKRFEEEMRKLREFFAKQGE